MTATDRARIAAVLGAELADDLIAGYRDATEEGVRIGLGMAARTLTDRADQIGIGAHALRTAADDIRALSADFTLKDPT